MQDFIKLFNPKNAEALNLNSDSATNAETSVTNTDPVSSIVTDGNGVGDTTVPEVDNALSFFRNPSNVNNIANYYVLKPESAGIIAAGINGAIPQTTSGIASGNIQKA